MKSIGRAILLLAVSFVGVLLLSMLILYPLLLMAGPFYDWFMFLVLVSMPASMIAAMFWPLVYPVFDCACDLFKGGNE